MKLSNELSFTIAIFTKVKLERIVFQSEVMMHVNDVCFAKKISCFPVVGFPIEIPSKSSAAVRTGIKDN